MAQMSGFGPGMSQNDIDTIYHIDEMMKIQTQTSFQKEDSRVTFWANSINVHGKPANRKASIWKPTSG